MNNPHTLKKCHCVVCDAEVDPKDKDHVAKIQRRGQMPLYVHFSCFAETCKKKKGAAEK